MARKDKTALSKTLDHLVDSRDSFDFSRALFVFLEKLFRKAQVILRLGGSPPSVFEKHDLEKELDKAQKELTESRFSILQAIVKTKEEKEFLQKKLSESKKESEIKKLKDRLETKTHYLSKLELISKELELATKEFQSEKEDVESKIRSLKVTEFAERALSKFQLDSARDALSNAEAKVIVSEANATLSNVDARPTPTKESILKDQKFMQDTINALEYYSQVIEKLEMALENEKKTSKDEVTSESKISLDP